MPFLQATLSAREIHLIDGSANHAYSLSYASAGEFGKKVQGGVGSASRQFGDGLAGGNCRAGGLAAGGTAPPGAGLAGIVGLGSGPAALPVF